jgi:hypothetical protein
MFHPWKLRCINVVGLGLLRKQTEQGEEQRRRRQEEQTEGKLEGEKRKVINYNLRKC